MSTNFSVSTSFDTNTYKASAAASNPTTTLINSKTAYSTQETETCNKSVFTDCNTNTSYNYDESDISDVNIAKEITTGALNKITSIGKNVMQLAKKNPVLAVAAGIGTIAIGLSVGSLIAAGGIPATIVGGAMIAGGIFFGAKDCKEVYNSINDAKEAKNNKDTDAYKEALNNIGGEGLDVLGDIALVATGAEAVKGASMTIQGAKMLDGAYAEVEDLYNAGKSADYINRVFKASKDTAGLATLMGDEVCQGAGIAGGIAAGIKTGLIAANTEENYLDK